MDNKALLEEAWLSHMTGFKFLGPHPYLRNGWS